MNQLEMPETQPLRCPMTEENAPTGVLSALIGPSFKRADLKPDGRYALHSLPSRNRWAERKRKMA